MRSLQTLAVVILVLVPVTAYAGFTADLGYGSGLMVEAPDSGTPVRTNLIFVTFSGDWRFPQTQWGVGINLHLAAPDEQFSYGVERIKAELIYAQDNFRLFAGPTWTTYQDSQGRQTKLEGIEIGGRATVDFTQALHLQGLFSFSPVLEGASVILPGPFVDTTFSGNISEYYFGIAYDFSRYLSATAGLGGWRVLEPVNQERLVTVDYRRIGLAYSF